MDLDQQTYATLIEFHGISAPFDIGQQGAG